MYNVGRPLIHDVLLCFLLEVLVTNWGYTVAAVSAQRQRPLEHVKNALQNSKTEGTHHSVDMTALP